MGNQCCQSANKGEDANTINSRIEEQSALNKLNHNQEDESKSSMIVNAELLKQRSKEKSYTSDKDDIKSNDGSKRQSLSKAESSKSDHNQIESMREEEEEEKKLNNGVSQDEEKNQVDAQQGHMQQKVPVIKQNSDRHSSGNKDGHSNSLEGDRKTETSNKSTMRKSQGDAKNSERGTSAKRKDEKKPSTKNELNISADIFIHLKKGNITEQYKVQETLGEGAFGHVSKVVHKTTQMVRAMKVLKKSSLIKEEEQRLFSEMNILKQLDHPHIIRLYELYQDSKCYYLVTEYCSGGELFDKIKSMSHFTEKVAADYMKQLLSALVYMHKHSIVHRDLKPENLILESDRKNAPLKVIDFGTSRRYESKKMMTKRLGTPYYIAPEVLRQSYDEKCDVWSCGVILYILLCGYPPFGGKSEDEILKKVKAGKFRFEAEDWDHISKEAKQLIKNMLTLDPKKRYSAEQALNDTWVQKNAPQLQISGKALQSLQRFQTRSKLKQAVLTFIVSQIAGREEKEELDRTFRQLDRNGDGRLSKEELIEGYMKVYATREIAVQQVDRIMEQVDTNKSGVVDYTAMTKEQILSKQKIDQAFQMFDADGNGYIERNELEQIMGQIDDEQWLQILEDCDTNKDGKISQQEFIDLLKKNQV